MRRTGIVRKRAAAARDLTEHYVFLAEETGLKVADEFLDSAGATFRELAGAPGSGSLVATERIDLQGLRKWRVKGFENILIFYQPIPGGVSIVRVIHGSRNWWSLFDVRSQVGRE